MFIDICFPRGNEDEFLARARELGTKDVMFVYREIPREKKSSYTAGIAGSQFSKRAQLVLGSGNRALFENPRVHLLHSQERISPKDSIRGPKSGMNEVLTKILRDKGKAYGIAIADLMENPRLLARFKQNVKLCEDYNVPLVLASFASKPSQLRSADDYASIAIMLGVQKPAVALRNLHDHLEKPSTE